MRSETSSFRMGHLAITHTKLPKEIDLWVMGYITPVYRGLYIYPMTHRTLFSPSPRALPMQRPIANGTRQKPAFVPGRKAGCLRQSGQSGGRGQRRAARDTQRFFGKGGAGVYLCPLACFYFQRDAGLSCRASGCRAACPPDGDPAQRETTGGVGGLT